MLERRGHTEAAVDLCRLAGLAPAAVICEVLHDDGSPARLPFLELFAQEHRVAIISVEQIAEHRLAIADAVRRAVGQRPPPPLVGARSRRCRPRRAAPRAQRMPRTERYAVDPDRTGAGPISRPALRRSRAARRRSRREAGGRSPGASCATTPRAAAPRSSSVRLTRGEPSSEASGVVAQPDHPRDGRELVVDRMVVERVVDRSSHPRQSTPGRPAASARGRGRVRPGPGGT